MIPCEDHTSVRTTTILRVLAAISFASVAAYACFWIVYLFLNRWPGQKEVVTSGYGIIQEARQIDNFFSPAWHGVYNYREPDLVEWQTEACLWGRYELNMAIDVRVDRRTGRVMEVVGEPEFKLREIGAVQGSQGVTYKSESEFGTEKWQQVVQANGDFSVIGIFLNHQNPVPGINRYFARPRNGIRIRTDVNETTASQPTR